MSTVNPWDALPPHWRALRAKALFSERRELCHSADVHLTPSQHHGVLPQAEYMERTGARVVLNLAGQDNMKHVEPGDFIIHLRSFQGGLEFSPHAGKVSTAYTVLKPSSEVYVGFFRWLFKSDRYISALAGLTNQLRDGQSIKFADFARIGLLLPPLDAQRRIADFLDDQVALLDRAIRLRQDQIDLMQEHWKALIREIVAGAGTPTRGAPAEAPWIARLHEQAEVRPLGRTITLQRGVDLTADERVEGPHPVVTTGGIMGHHNQFVVPQSGVVIGRYGTVGSVFWIEGKHWPHNTTLYVKDYKANLAKYVYYLLQAYPYERLQARAAVPGVNRNDMHRDLMPWLPVALQAHAVDLLDSGAETTSVTSRLMQESINLLSERKQALITAAVTGEFDVATARSVA